VGELSTAGAGYRADWSAWAQALLPEADGEPAQAFKALSDCWDGCARCGHALDYPVIGPDLVRLALAADDVGRARDVAAAVTGVASRNEVPWITGAALRCQGLAEDDADTLDAAVRAYARGSHSLELALACEDAGAAFARRGNLDRAGQLLDQAITTYERFHHPGADRLAERGRIGRQADRLRDRPPAAVLLRRVAAGHRGAAERRVPAGPAAAQRRPPHPSRGGHPHRVRPCCCRWW
jgi:hypothetical protein